MTAATKATVEFLGRLHPEDEIAIIPFSTKVQLERFAPHLANRDWVGQLSNYIQNLNADGETALYEAVCEATKQAKQLQATHQESRLYGIVLLSDGKNEQEGVSDEEKRKQMYADCLPEGVEANGVKIFPIAYGAQADTNLLKEIARVTGGRYFEATPASIADVYLAISAEQ